MSDTVDIIKIEKQLPIITGNFDAEKAMLAAELDKYKNVLVTEETLKDDKKLAGALSAKGRVYNSERIRIVGEISKPIVAFTGQMKELSNLCTDTANLISNQVKVFEAAKLDQLKLDLLSFLLETRDKLNIISEHRTSEIDPKLIKLGSITAKGAINKSAKDAIVAIVTAEQVIQQRTSFRLLQLESESHKAGLLSPLDRVSIETFLFEDDDTYAIHLQKVITIELGRQEQAAEKLQAEADRRAATKAKEAAQIEADRLAAMQPVDDTPKHEPDFQPVNPSYAHAAEHQEVTQDEYAQYEQAQSTCDQVQFPEREVTEQNSGQVKTGNIAVIATAQFELSVPEHVNPSQINAKLRGILEAAGITSCKSITVRRA